MRRFETDQENEKCLENSHLGRFQEFCSYESLLSPQMKFREEVGLRLPQYTLTIRVCHRGHSYCIYRKHHCFKRFGNVSQVCRRFENLQLYSRSMEYLDQRIDIIKKCLPKLKDVDRLRVEICQECILMARAKE